WPLPPKKDKPEPVWQLHLNSGIRSAAFGPKAEQVLVVGAGGELKAIDAKTGKEAKAPAVPGQVLTLGLVGDVLRAVVLEGPQMRVWSAADNKSSPGVQPPEPTSGVALSPGATRLAVTGQSGTVRVYDVASGRELQSFADGARQAPAFVSDRTLVVAAADKSARVVDVAVTAVQSVAGGVALLTPMPNGPQLVVAGTDKVVRLVQAATGQGGP